jgi:hypothetical protein
MLLEREPVHHSPKMKTKKKRRRRRRRKNACHQQH